MIDKKLKKNKKYYIIIASSIASLWLILLTLFSAWAWNMHIWQAENDSKAILNLMIENGKQQVELDELRSRE